METFLSPRAAFQIKVFRTVSLPFVSLTLFLLSTTTKEVSCFNQKTIYGEGRGKQQNGWESSILSLCAFESFDFFEHLSANMIFQNSFRAQILRNDDSLISSDFPLEKFSFQIQCRRHNSEFKLRTDLTIYSTQMCNFSADRRLLFDHMQCGKSYGMIYRLQFIT